MLVNGATDLNGYMKHFQTKNHKPCIDFGDAVFVAGDLYIFTVSDLKCIPIIFLNLCAKNYWTNAELKNPKNKYWLQTDMPFSDIFVMEYPLGLSPLSRILLVTQIVCLGGRCFDFSVLCSNSFIWVANFWHLWKLIWKENIDGNVGAVGNVVEDYVPMLSLKLAHFWKKKRMSSKRSCCYYFGQIILWKFCTRSLAHQSSRTKAGIQQELIIFLFGLWAGAWS